VFGGRLCVFVIALFGLLSLGPFVAVGVVTLLLLRSGRDRRERLVVMRDRRSCQAANDQGARYQQDAKAAEAIEQVCHQVTPLPTPRLGAMVDTLINAGGRPPLRPSPYFVVAEPLLTR
jgi:hypothetical protein